MILLTVINYKQASFLIFRIYSVRRTQAIEPVACNNTQKHFLRIGFQRLQKHAGGFERGTLKIRSPLFNRKVKLKIRKVKLKNESSE